MSEEEINDLSHKIIGAAIEVHKILGPGLLEDIYRDALVYELGLRGINCRKEVEVPILYKGMTIGSNKYIDILVEDQIVLELKSVQEMNETFHKQILTYMKLLEKPLGLLINFNVPLLKDGITRKVHNL